MGNLKDYATSLVVTAPVTPTAGTSLTVTTGEAARFPATPFFATLHPDNAYPTLDNSEKVQVTGIVTNTFTIVRAQGSTTAKTVVTGWRISNAVFVGDILNPSSNLSDLASASTARTNLGLGSLAVLSAVDLTTNVTGILPSANGGTANGFTKFTGPATAEKTFTLPNASATLLYDGGALGTPSSATLTNALGLPIAGLTPSTVTSLGVGSLELGHATDTTISRVSAGVIAVEGINVLLNGGALGTPASGTLTNATGLPISTGVSGLGTGVATFLATPSSANLRAALTDEAGTGVAYFVGGALGTPASATLTNATGLPISTGLSGAGTGVLAALAIATSSAGGLVLFNGAGGTPSSLTLTNATGLPVSGITPSTSTALGLGTIELGAATDTTLSRSAAGQLAVEGVDVLTTSNTKTLTNKTLDGNGTGNSVTNASTIQAKQQNNTSNSAITGVRIETGWGVFAQGAAANKSETVTFNTAFNTAPIVTISYNGDQTGGTIAYGNGGNTVKGPVTIKCYGMSTTAFTAHVHTPDGTLWGATDNVYYSWIAIGN